MRARRPELFSDSQVRRSDVLSRDTFEYLLNVITSRKQEIDFEHFCRRLAEAEICPNLIPQTGPTGGGDSKVDSETYPVAQRIAERWYIADPMSATQERWAFAFSAKREWRTKLRSDVQGIVDTQRGYRRIYFITNQFVKDKTRAQVESELSDKLDVAVHIMDRSWILKCVFEHDRQALAVETLHLDVPSKAAKVLGVRDAHRTQELDETEKRISDPSRYTGVEYQLVEECLSAAILTRELERPRSEVDGQFTRAQRLADSVGTAQQRLRVAYQRGWTAYWWYEDLAELLKMYEVVESLALSSQLSDDAELAVNLWQLLSASCDSGKLDRSKIDLDVKANDLVAHLARAASDEERPNNALWARTQLVILDLLRSCNGPVQTAAAIKQMKDVVSASEGLISFPLMGVAKLIEGLGEFFADFSEYDELIEEIARVTEVRVGRRQAGRILSARGFQKLRANAIYDAIRFFGRAQQQLGLRETREELASALFAGGLAYEAAGLLWAARANTLASVGLILADFEEGGEMPKQVLNGVQKLIWQELQLGRVPQILQWLELNLILASSLGLDDSDRKAFVEQRESQDKALALLFLKASLADLGALRFLPSALERLNLLYARMALLYALGYECTLREEGSVPPEESSEALLTTFTNFMKNDASADLPLRPTGLESNTSILTSPVLGSRLVVAAEHDFDSLRLGERILAGCEALFATSLDTDLFPYREELKVEVLRDKGWQGPPRIADDPTWRDTLKVRHNGNLTNSGKKIADWFLDLLTKVLTSLVVLPSPHRYMKQVFGEESGLGRALNFTESAVTIGNIFGRQPKETLSAWNEEGKENAYDVRRDAPWHGDELSDDTETPRTDPTPGVGDIPEELLNRQTKHTERRVASVIDIPLWDKAEWRGALFVVPADFNGEPLMGLGFRNGEAGRKIFKGWRERIGTSDDQNRIRVSIITGIDKAHPHAYRVVISSNLPNPKDATSATQFMAVGRVQRMDAETSVNRERFEKGFSNAGSYRLFPAELDFETGRWRPFYDLPVTKTDVRIVPAWRIGENDMDGMGILPDDDPVIPAGEVNAPVLNLLGAKRRGNTRCRDRTPS